MKASPQCYACLEKLAQQAVGLTGLKGNAFKNAVDAAVRCLHSEFSLDVVSVTVASKIHRTVREISGNSDPYRQMKRREIRLSSRLFPLISSIYGTDIADLIKLAAVGNTIDFFRDLDAIQSDMLRPVNFYIDDTAEFISKLKVSNRILFLADNAGEIRFDIPLLNHLRQSSSVTYAVKSGVVQDDTTIDDIRAAGLIKDIGDVITTGTDTPGIDIKSASKDFLRIYEQADLILAKGMGYYEALTELPASGKVLHCLMAKCTPVAFHIGVPLNSFVAIMR